MKSFQTLFPPLSPQNLSLSSARRVVLVAYNAERGTVDWRHYLITVKPYGVSRRVRRVLEGAPAKSSSSKSRSGFLNLGSEKDVADFLLRRRGEPGPASDGYESATSDGSSAAGDDADAVSLADDYVGRNNRKGQRRAVRLDEIGPRMELRLIKIMEGVPGKEGAVIYHDIGTCSSPFLLVMVFILLSTYIVKKTKAEASAQKAAHAAKEKLRKERREEQERNVQKKKAAAGGKAEEGGDMDQDEEEQSEDEEEHDEMGVWDDEEDISEGEEVQSDEEGSDAADSDSDDEPPRRPPSKKLKTHGKR